MAESSQELCPAWHNEEERQRLIAAHLSQVRYIASRIYHHLPRYVAFEDLMNAGVVGLLDAIEKFDERKHVQLSSYAKFRIRGAILDSLRAMDWSPRDLRRQGREVQQARANLQLELGRDPTEVELAQELDVPLRELQKLLNEIHSLHVGSAHAVSAEDGREADLWDRLPATRENGPLAEYLRSESRDLLVHAMQGLPERERRVLTLYYFEELTMKEAGAVMGIGESRVSQIHSAAVARLRGRMAELMSRRKVSRRRAAAGGS